jgi:imidazolonepropionase-like amidohydrolase
VKKAIEKGVMVVNGSDMYLFNKIPQGQAAKNTLDTYFEACNNPADVLKTATKNAAIACGVDGFTGVIKENMAADIVAFEGDLEKDFKKTLYKVKFVMKEGQIYVR